MANKSIIDQLDLENERLVVRNLDLTKIMTKYRFVDVINLLLQGKSFHKKEAWFKTLFQKYFSNIDLRTTLIESTRNINDPNNSLMIAFLVVWEQTKDLSEKKRVFSVCSLLPCIFADIERRDLFFTIPDNILDRSLIEIIHYLVSEEGSKYISAFETVLISMTAGFGTVTPTVMTPRIVAGTGAGLDKCIISSIAASGKYHVGACNQFMYQFEIISNLKTNAQKQSFLNSKIKNGETIYGFGHPILHRDPRVNILKQKCNTYHDFKTLLLIEKFMMQTKGVKMNIDGMAGFIFLRAGVRKQLGSLLFIFARSFAVIAHSIQKRSSPPFGYSKGELREKYKEFPFNWV